MAKMRKTNRKTCRIPDTSICLSPTASRHSNTIVDTPRRVRLLRDAHFTAGKLPRKELFKKHNVAEATNYHILKSNLSRRSHHVHNRGQKPVLTLHERDTIKTVEDASFLFASRSYYANTSAISLANGSERAI
jgi:hypothetical protein